MPATLWLLMVIISGSPPQILSAYTTQAQCLQNQAGQPNWFCAQYNYVAPDGIPN